MSLKVEHILALFIALSAVPGFAQDQIDNLNALLAELLQEQSVVIDSPDVQFGVAGPCERVLDKGYYVINYNDDWKIANWVGYYLCTEYLEHECDRTNDFRWCYASGEIRHVDVFSIKTS